ncbi:hypothetical protein GCM10028895_13850 [Pontibacter rugosus]
MSGAAVTVETVSGAGTTAVSGVATDKVSVFSSGAIGEEAEFSWLQAVARSRQVNMVEAHVKVFFKKGKLKRV